MGRGRKTWAKFHCCLRGAHDQYQSFLYDLGFVGAFFVLLKKRISIFGILSPLSSFQGSPKARASYGAQLRP